MNSILTAQNITVVYKIGYKSVKILDDISFSVEFGEYLCVIGSNGSGKSTLVKSLLGLINVAKGNVSLGVSDNEISYLPQVNTIPQDFPATIYEVILSGTQTNNKELPFYKKTNHENAREALRLVDLDQIQNRKFGELSRGQQQRVLLARTLAKKPKLLFLDEPCASLDEDISNQFYDILEKLNKEQKVSIVMISHDLAQVAKYATHVLYLNKKTLFCGTMEKWSNFPHKDVKCIH
ncbi:MAG: metal ABC transporter ATP-binding protein [Oscillospiraceae bacterium]|nr:metal ABC transporter ATP-binding protein [Oscillospiraceae bacterium]